MDVEKILIVRTSALGDVVHTLPALAALREIFPRARIAWLVEPAGALLLRGHPQIDELYVFDRPRWKREWRRPVSWPGLLKEFFRLVRKVRRERFDLVIDFQCNIRSGFAVFLSGGKRRLGFSRADSSEWGGYLFTNEKAPRCPTGIHKVQKNFFLLKKLGWNGDSAHPILAVPEEERNWSRDVVAGLPGQGPVIVLHPAVSRFGEFKRWPAENFRRLADLARAELDARILITWGPGERDRAEAIDRPTVAPAIQSPLQMAALLSQANALVAADTAALHIAAILGIPVIGLFGPKDHRLYGPYPPGPHTRSIQSTAACSPCLLRRCEHKICMSLIFPEDVFKALREVLV